MVDEVETRLSRARVSSTQRDRYETRQISVTRLSRRIRGVLEASSDGKKTSKESATRCTAIT